MGKGRGTSGSSTPASDPKQRIRLPSGTRCLGEPVLASEKLKSAQQEKTRSDQAGVRIAFDHFGKAIDPSDLRIGETGELKTSLLPGDDIWLRLYNESQHVISFETYSGYININETARTKKLVVGLLTDGLEVGIVARIEDAKGRRPIADRPGTYEARLPPNTSVLFSIPRHALAAGASVYVECRILEAGEGRTNQVQRVYFRESDLPKRKQPALIIVSGDEYSGAIIPPEIAGAQVWMPTSSDVMALETDLRRLLTSGLQGPWPGAIDLGFTRDRRSDLKWLVDNLREFQRHYVGRQAGTARHIEVTGCMGCPRWREEWFANTPGATHPPCEKRWYASAQMPALRVTQFECGGGGLP